MIPRYDVVPTESVGPFQLGDSLWHVLEILRLSKVHYPKVEVAWDADNAAKSAVTIHLPHLDLYFPASIHQTLTLILISSLADVVLLYSDRVLSSATERLTRARVAKLLGPTHAGGSSGKISYPGIEFDFGSGSLSGREDRVQRIKLSPREDDSEMVTINPIVSCVLRPGKGVTIFLPDPLDITIGKTTAVDLRTDLGTPTGKYWKSDDRLARMWGSAGSIELKDGYRFWNYFQYGLDFLLDPDSVVCKIICHSNLPGTPLFQRYARCPWTLPSSIGDLTFDSPIVSFRSNLSAKAHASYVDEVRLSVPDKSVRPVSPGSTSSKGSESGKVSAKRTESTKSTAMKKKAQSQPGRAEVIDWKEDIMVLDRLSEEGYEGVNGVSPSRLLGFDGIIVEEDQASGGICSVLIWRDDQGYSDLKIT